MKKTLLVLFLAAQPFAAWSALPDFPWLTPLATVARSSHVNINVTNCTPGWIRLYGAGSRCEWYSANTTHPALPRALPFGLTFDKEEKLVMVSYMKSTDYNSGVRECSALRGHILYKFGPPTKDTGAGTMFPQRTWTWVDASAEESIQITCELNRDHDFGHFTFSVSFLPWSSRKTY